MAKEDFNDYLAFLAVARERSFTRAALRRGVSQSTLSHTIRRLEERLGLPLLMRTTRNVSLTEAGERLMAALVPRIDEIEAEIAQMTQLRDTPAGTVRLTVSDHMIHQCIWPRLAPVLKDYPDIKVEMAQENGFVDVIEGRFDAGVRLGEGLPRDMVAVRVGPDWRLALIGSTDYLARAGVPRHPHDLVNHNCINIRQGNSLSLYAWEFEKDGEEVVIKVDGQLTFTSIYPMLPAVADGYGLALVPHDVAMPGVLAGHYETILDDWCEYFTGYHLYYPNLRHVSPALRVVIDALRYRGPLRPEAS